MAGPGTEPPDRETGGGDYHASDGVGENPLQETNQFSESHQSINKTKTSSYADRLKTNVRFDQRLKRNVLEITLEKTGKDSNLDVSQADIVRVFTTLGIDITTQVQGYQVQFKGKVNVISVWMAPGISLDRFCKDVNIRVKEGVMTGLIRPEGKTDVKVSIVGLDFNTPDTFVFDYLSKFGVVTSKTVVYSKYEIGPFKGKFNGERKYQVDFKNAPRHMGTFHLIDGCKVRVFYRGNKKTCGRCHKTAEACPGKSIAKECESNGGDRVFLSLHMKYLWSEVGFVPANFEIDEEEDVCGEPSNEANVDAPVIVATSFPAITKPEPTNRDVDKYNGITIRNIPSTLDDKSILQFLINYGVPTEHDSDHIRITKKPRNSSVFVDSLTPEQVQVIFKSLHFHETNQKFFDVPIYCKPLRNMTPVKTAVDSDPKDVNIEALPKPPTTGNPKSIDDAPAPNANDAAIGLSRSEKKKAQKEAKEKKKADDKRKEEEERQEEKKKINNKKKNLDSIKKDFMKDNVLETSTNLEEQFEFEDSPAALTPSVTNGLGSKFFSTTPLKMLSPTPLKSFAARQIIVEHVENEELLKNAAHKNDLNDKKHRMTPEDEDRNTRFKDGKGAQSGKLKKNV